MLSYANCKFYPGERRSEHPDLGSGVARLPVHPQHPGFTQGAKATGLLLMFKLHRFPFPLAFLSLASHFLNIISTGCR